MLEAARTNALAGQRAPLSVLIRQHMGGAVHDSRLCFSRRLAASSPTRPGGDDRLRLALQRVDWVQGLTWLSCASRFEVGAGPARDKPDSRSPNSEKCRMNIQRQLSILSLAIAAALPVVLPTAALAQTRVSPSETRITSLGVEQIRRLRPGNVLSFSLNGTPGAAVTLQIAGATKPLQMNEVRPGEYAGDYTIRTRDRLTAASTVTARLLKNGRTTTAMLGSSLLLGASDPTPVATAPITAFTVVAADGFQPGDEVNFSLKGKPGGAARVAVQGVDKRIVLTEVSRGVYEGSYVIRRQDRLQGEFSADGYLMSDRLETSQHFERRFDRSGNETGRIDGREGRDGRDTGQQPPAACANCGSIESVNVVEVKGDSPNVIGTIAGGLLGGVVGHQVGGGSGKDLATIVGAVGGAYAGNRVENNMGKTKVYRVAVRLDGGSVQSFDYATDPSVQVGTRVKVENGVLIRL